MKLPEVLKQAILQGDWKLVCTVYTAITGEQIEPPKPKPTEVNLADIEIELPITEIRAGPLKIEIPKLGPPPKKRGRPKKKPTIVVDDSSDAVTRALNQNPNIAVVDFTADDNGEMNEAVASTLVQNERDNVGKGKEVTFGQEITSDMQEFAAPSRRPAEGKRTVKKSEDDDGRSPGRLEEIIIPEPGTRQNRFQDNGLAVQHERVDINPALGAPTKAVFKKERETASFVEIECGLCHSKVKVAAALATGYSPDPEHNAFRCNNCCSSKRGRNA